MPFIQINSRRFYSRFGMPLVEYRVLYDGVEYLCDDAQLDLLYDGFPPEDLDLIRLETVPESWVND